MTKSVFLAAAALTALLAGCSAHSSAPAATATGAVSLPPGCAAALAALPKSPPDTKKQALADTTALGGQKGTTLDSLADAVSGDSVAIDFDLTDGEPVTHDVTQWMADAAALRSFCS